MLILIGVLWAFNILNWITGSHLNKFGIIPRRARGLIGIVFAPILHGNFTHLLFNTVPLFFLGIFVMSLDQHTFYWATGIIIFLAGLGVWIVGRRGNHIGASALISGYFGYILASAYKQPTFTTFFCAAVAMYYFGSILFSLFPTDEDTSWEGHLSGFVAGLIAMVFCQKFDYLLKGTFFT
jgi:membrane associated rhomboid family serine protease